MLDVDAQTRRDAYFEAGHAIGAWLEGFAVEHAVFCPADGEMWCDIVEPILPERGLLLSVQDRAGATALIRALLSGPAAQEIHSFGSCSDDLTLSDRDFASETRVWRAAGLTRRLGNRGTILPLLWRNVRDNLDRRCIWTAVTVIARRLMERGELTGREVEEVAHRPILPRKKARF